MKLIYNAASKLLLYHCKHPENPRVLLLGPTGITAVNIGETIIHSGLGIKPGIRLLGLNDKSKAALRNKLSEAKYLIIDELSMISSDLWVDINSRLQEIYMIIEKVFSGLSVMTVGDFLQLPPVLGKFIFTPFSHKHRRKDLLGLQLWHLFKYAELTEVVRQNDKPFIDMLNKVRVGNADNGMEQLLTARIVCDFEEKFYPKDALHMYAENETAIGRNKAVLNNFRGELYTIEADNKNLDNCKYPLAMIIVAQNQKQTITGGLAKLLKLKICAKVMLTVNVEIVRFVRF